MSVEEKNSPERAKRLILRFGEAAEREMNAVKSACPLTEEAFNGHMFNYILYKFLLLPEEVKSRDFNDLAEQSLAKSAGISKDLVKEFDQAQSCSGTSSVMAKKVLLFMKLQRELNIKLPAEGSARVKSIDELIRLVWLEASTDRDSAVFEHIRI